MDESGFLFRRDGDRFVPTGHTQGPWAIGLQFGGAPTALIAHVVEAVPTLAPMGVARLTVDLLRPVPIEPLEVCADVRREGKRLQVVDISLSAAGREVAAARALRLRSEDLSDLELPRGEPRPRPADAAIHEKPSRSTAEEQMRGTLQYALRPGGELFRDPTWVRLRVPVVAGHPTSPLERTAYVADSCSGVGHPFDLPVTGINADLTLSIVRPCEGEWLCIEGSGWTGAHDGIGTTQARLSDAAGVVAGVSMSRLVDREPSTGTA